MIYLNCFDSPLMNTDGNNSKQPLQCKMGDKPDLGLCNHSLDPQKLLYVLDTTLLFFQEKLVIHGNLGFTNSLKYTVNSSIE